MGNVTVSGAWSAGSGGTTCITNTSGQCTVPSSSLNKKTSGVTSTVSNLVRSGWTYVPANDVTGSVTLARP